MKKFKFRKGDKVIVNTGVDKGKTGEILKIITKNNRAIVEGVNIVHKHEKPSANNPQGGIKEVEASIDVSNLSHLDKEGNPTRVGFRFNKEGNKERFAKKSGEVI